MKIETYIFFTDQCAEAMQFYEKVLGGKIEAMMTYGDSPAGPHNPPEMARQGHPCAPRRRRRGADGLGRPGSRERKGFAVTLQVDTVAEADRLFNALSEGGTVTMPIGETFFSKRFGMLTDRFGVPWMVNCVQPSDPEQRVRHRPDRRSTACSRSRACSMRRASWCGRRGPIRSTR